MAALGHLWPGLFGVALFFLISGFVIPFSLERNSVGGFFTRRLFRLYPTLWVAIGVTLAVLAVQAWALGTGFAYGAGEAGSSAVLVGVYLGRPWVDPVYWTLAIEEIFYVIAALCAWRGVLHRPVTVMMLGAALTTASVGIARMAAPTTSVPAFWYLRTHAARNAAFVVFILIGVAFHEHYRGSWRTGTSIAVGAGLAGLFAVCLYHGPFPDDQPEAFGVSSLAALGLFGGLYLVRNRLRYVRSLDWLADVSYPLYLVHTIVGWVLMSALHRLIPSYAVVLPLTLAAVVGLAWAIHRWVELPTTRLGRRLSPGSSDASEPPVDASVIRG